MDDQEFNVPDDFPQSQTIGAVGGFQNKVLLVAQAGKFYSPGCTPAELYARWDVCEDLAQQFSRKCVETKSGKRAQMTEVEILEQYYFRSLKMNWGSPDEMKWVFRRTASLIGWPVPPCTLTARS